jgi:colanic acid/amylovoran biosynthesis protein
MPNILITYCHGYHSKEHNKGTIALMISTIESLRQQIPDAKFTTLDQFSEDFAREHDIEVVRHKAFSNKSYSLGTLMLSSLNLVQAGIWRMTNKHFRIFSQLLVNNRNMKAYIDADVIIHMGMDLYSDDFGPIEVTENSKEILTCTLLKKRVIIWAESPGPFKSRLTSWLVRMALKGTTLITVREDLSMANLNNLKISGPPIYLTADPAFLLNPASKERAEEIFHQIGLNSDDNTYVIGLTLSWSLMMLKARNSKYLIFMRSVYRIMRELLPEAFFAVIKRSLSKAGIDSSSHLNTDVMVQVVNYLTDDLKATVVLIPHDTTPGMDDSLLARDVARKVNSGNRVKVMGGDNSPAETKAVIGQCDLFIGSKMHANIGALSMHVPTVAIQYSHKFFGIMKSLGLEEYVCDKFSLERVKLTVDRAWTNREKIASELPAKMDKIRFLAAQNARLVADLLNSHPTGPV